MHRQVAVSAIIVLVFASALSADVKLPAILGDNMCLQANKPLPIWGTADVGEKVTVTLDGQSQFATADAAGKWKVTLAALPPSDAPATMTVAGKNTLAVHNILVGSVWICSGQSNMDFGITKTHHAEADVAQARHPALRLFAVGKATALDPRPDVTVRDVAGGDLLGKWFECSPETIVRGGWGGYSAVAYFFGRDLQEGIGQPVGLINSSCGASPAQAWVSLSGLKADPLLSNYVEMVEPYIGDPEKVREKLKADLAVYDEAQQKWEAENKAFAAWKEAAARAKAENQPAPAKPKDPGRAPGKPISLDRSSQAPTTLFTGMIAPLIPYAIEGAIWYQGEANTGHPIEYRTLLQHLISDWRERWGEGDFPFLVVQLPNVWGRRDMPTDTDLPWLREAQAMALKLPNTGVATTIDIGEGGDLHPHDKSDVGHRLALLALNKVFGKKIVGSGPMYESMTVEGNKVRLTFKEIGSGLKIGVSPLAPSGSAAAFPASELTGFAIAGEDRNFVWAKAAIEGNQVVAWNDQIAKPVAVRYAWADNPACNLYNKENLPAMPFRTDDWARPEAK